MKSKSWIKKSLKEFITSKYFNIFLLIFATCISLLIGEGILRVLYHPIDHLKPQLINDEILGVKVKPNSASHDSWGFRNQRVPEASEIVAIGDSQTYGINATANHSWPAILQRLLNKSVYNMSIGSYGPPQYYYLLEKKALQLHPSLVIVGFYYGNDLMNSYDSIYNRDYFKYLRNSNLSLKLSLSKPETILYQKTIFQKIQSWYRGNTIHIWLGSHSMFYDIVRHQIRNIGAYSSLKISLNQGASLESENKNISTLFTPQLRLGVLNYNTIEVREGLRISLELFSRMKEICNKKNIRFLVVLIPTKESVYSKHIEGNIQITDSEIIDELIENERRVNRIVKKYFEEKNISYIDVLTSLQNEIGKQRIFPTYSDGHPNKNGYELISKDIQKWYIEQFPN